MNESINELINRRVSLNNKRWGKNNIGLFLLEEYNVKPPEALRKKHFFLSVK